MQLKQADFATFNVAENLIFQIGANFHQYFTHMAILIAECLADYYRTEGLTVTEYVGEKYDPVDHPIKEFGAIPADLKILLDELQDVQNPEHGLSQGWLGDDTRQRGAPPVCLSDCAGPHISGGVLP